MLGCFFFKDQRLNSLVMVWRFLWEQRATRCAQLVPSWPTHGCKVMVQADFSSAEMVCLLQSLALWKESAVLWHVLGCERAIMDIVF